MDSYIQTCLAQFRQTDCTSASTHPMDPEQPQGLYGGNVGDKKILNMLCEGMKSKLAGRRALRHRTLIGTI